MEVYKRVLISKELQTKINFNQLLNKLVKEFKKINFYKMKAIRYKQINLDQKISYSLLLILWILKIKINM